MLPLNDPRWQIYQGGYRIPYDASIPLRKLMHNDPTQAIWEELWNELHHQGDVDTASYAAVPYLVTYAQHQSRLDWNVFGLISTIELARPKNPPLPPELQESYFQAIQSIPKIIGEHPQLSWDDLLTQNIMSCIALARGQRILAEVYLELSLEAAKEWLQEQFGLDGEANNEAS